jgi:hypothetical protein
LKEILPTLWKMHVKIGMSIDMVKFMLCLQWGKIGLIPQLWHLIVGKPVREICTVPSSECFTLGNHPTSSRAPGRKFLPGGFMPNKVHPSSGPHQLSTCKLVCLLIPKPKHSQTKRASKTPRNCISRDFLCAAEK